MTSTTTEQGEREWHMACFLLDSIFDGYAEDHSSTIINILGRLKDHAFAGPCPECGAVAGTDCEQDASDLDLYGGVHRERWEAVCPDLFNLVHDGSYWVNDPNYELSFYRTDSDGRDIRTHFRGEARASSRLS